MANRYYSLHRPVSIGTAPAAGLVSFENFEGRRFVDEIGREAWGVLEYDRELTEDECFDYELFSAKLRTWFRVITSVPDSGLIRSGIHGFKTCAAQPAGREQQLRSGIVLEEWYPSEAEAQAAVDFALRSN